VWIAEREPAPLLLPAQQDWALLDSQGPDSAQLDLSGSDQPDFAPVAQPAPWMKSRLQALLAPEPHRSKMRTKTSTRKQE
jgi:hypothetical protein